MTHLAPLPTEAFARFRDISIAEYAEENVESGRWPAEGAEERSRQSYDELLTQGLATPNQHLFEMRDSAGAPVGFRHQLAIALGVERRQRHAPDIGEQADSKHFGGRCGPGGGAEQLGGDAGRR